MPSLASAAEVVERIVARGAPVLMLDTCAVLDIRRSLRSEQRQESGLFTQPGIQSPAHAKALLAAAEVPSPRCTFVCSELVRTEYDKHSGGVSEQTESLIRNLSNVLKGYGNVCRDIGLPVPEMPDVTSPRLPDALATLADNCLSAACVLPVTAPQLLDALDRCRIGQAPGHEKGLGAIIDAAIWVGYRELGRELVKRRFAPFGKSSIGVFLTGNTTDFSDDGGRRADRAHPDLEAEMASIHLGYASNWGAAEGSILHR